MPIDLQGGPPIVHGWGAAPELHAPALGELVKSILQNRQYQQEYTHRDIADAIKKFQTQRQDSAYAEALRNAGLTQGQDISGVGSKQATALAQLIAANTKDPLRDALIQAQTDEANARAGAINTYGGVGRGRGGAGGRSGSMVTVTDDNGDPILGADGNPVQVPAGSKLGQHVIAQQNSMLGAPTASVAANIATKMGIPPQAVTDTGVHQGMGLVPGSGVDAQGNPYETKYMPVSPGDEPTDIQVSPRGTDPKTQLPYQPVIVQKDTLEQLRRALQGSSYRPSRGAQPGDVNDQVPLPPSAPSATPPPSGAGSAGKVAHGYGTPSTDMSADDVRAAYRAGKMTREEAAARLKQLGFSD